MGRTSDVEKVLRRYRGWIQKGEIDQYIVSDDQRLKEEIEMKYKKRSSFEIVTGYPILHPVDRLRYIVSRHEREQKRDETN